MQFNNNGYYGSIIVSILCFILEASKVSCVLNNDGVAAAAGFPSAQCFASETQNDSQPLPSTLHS